MRERDEFDVVGWSKHNKIGDKWVKAEIRNCARPLIIHYIISCFAQAPSRSWNQQIPSLLLPYIEQQGQFCVKDQMEWRNYEFCCHLQSTLLQNDGSTIWNLSISNPCVHWPLISDPLMHERDNRSLNKSLKHQNFKFGLAKKVLFRSSDSFGLFRMKQGTCVDT